MKKKSALLIMILFISTFSYGRINNIRQNNIFLQQLRKQEDTLPKKGVHDFYNWYINDIYMIIHIPFLHIRNVVQKNMD